MRQRVKIYIAVLLFSGFCLHGFAIEPPVFEKKIIRDSLDNLIINIEKTGFLHISDNPEGKRGVKLHQEETPDRPMKFKNSGKHSFTYYNQRLKKDIPFYFIVDGVAPKTAWKSELPAFIRDDTIYGGENFEISFSSQDEYSGVKNIYYSVNGLEYQKYKAPLILESEDYYEIAFFAVDNVGNIEKSNKINIIVDHASPETQLVIIGDQHENVLSPRTEIKLEASARTGVKDIFYSINDQPAKAYSQKISVSHLSEGYHTITYFAIDKIKNKEQEKSFRFFIDKTPPIIIQEITGNRFVAGGKEYSSGRSQLRVTAVDNKAGVKEIYYSINDEQYELYKRPVFLSGHSGEVNIRTYALDKVNNKSEGRTYFSEETHIPYIDLNAPEIDFKIEGPQMFLRNTLFINDKSKINLIGVDRESGLNRIVYRINQGEERIFEEPFSIKKPGHHNINYTAFDNVDNANNDNFSLYVDVQGPEINHNFSIISYDEYVKAGNNYEIYPPHVKLYLSAVDEKTGANEIFYSINEQPEQLYTKPVKKFEAGQVNNISIRATDMLGNESFEEVSFYVTDSH